ncbi:MAG TPA: DUF1015 domain-containing protein [Candidatus Limnocylindrales bacterium]|nr:DUF1015 domain-containing protein [Candidatus Limnocylindrales bacterium]
MPELLPFPALRYDQTVVGDLRSVLCPPYDVVGAEERARLARQPYNAIRLELPDAADGEGRYRQAAQLLADWRASGALRLDDRPMVYTYEQAYTSPGAASDEAPRLARGFFCRLRLEQPGKGVLRHERTLRAPKEDRFRLLSTTRANLSPVLLLFRSPEDGAASGQLLERLAQGTPIAATTFDGVRQRLWAADPSRSADAQRLLDLASSGPLAIADGHHRYETALRYRDEIGGPGCDAILCLLYDADSGGLTVLPTHRVLRGLPETESLLAGLQDLFEIEPMSDAAAIQSGLEQGSIGLWTRQGGGLLAPRRERIDPLLPAGSKALRALDVTILASALQQVLGLSTAALDEQGKLEYIKDADQAVSLVSEGAADACFLLNPTPVQAVLEVASAGELMPPKSTYFVPKAATGLVFNLLST